MPLSRHAAVVLDDRDPEQAGRLQVMIPTLSGTDAPWPDWVPPRLPGCAGEEGAGLVWIPPQQSVVVVEAEAGGAGGIWWVAGELGARSRLPAPLRADYPATSGWVDRAGDHAALLGPDGARLQAFDAAGGVAAQLRAASSGVRVEGARIDLTGPGATPAHPYLLTAAFFADLALVLAEVVAVGAASAIPTPATSQMILDLATSLSAGAPYLSRRIRGD